MTQIHLLPAGVEAHYNVQVPMRDGVHLSTDIYFPKSQSGPFPAILSRIPYNNMGDWYVDPCIFLAQHGYVAMAQDTRGRYDSEGEFYPYVNEFNDGHDTIEWIGAQPWCDGNVGMVGASYVAHVQWMAAAMGSHYLKAIVPRVIGNNLHIGQYQDGAFQLGLTATWCFTMAGRTSQNIDKHNWDRIFLTLPLRDLPKAGGKDITYFQDFLDHPDYDDFWKEIATKERYGDIKIPALQIGGWYDMATAGTFETFMDMQERGGSDLARSNQRVIMGPWVHRATVFTNAGEVDFGIESMLDLNEVHLRWFDHWLKGIDNGAERDAPVRLWVMGINQWRDEQKWPLARTNFTPYYFHSGGQANSLLGDGTLSTGGPSEEPPDSYVYNPAFPVPSRGGGACCNPEIVPWGAHDQRPVEHRSDVLVYTSEPLEEDLEVTGPVIVKLFASTDGRDTDFTAKLVDVAPDGYAVNLCDGIIRGRYRETTDRQRLLEPGTVYEFTVDPGPTSNVFLKGHRIRLDISSSNFPRFDRNPNTGNKFGEDAELRVARQQVFHDGARASHIILPVIPRS